jgi:hypothetical protein
MKIDGDGGRRSWLTPRNRKHCRGNGRALLKDGVIAGSAVAERSPRQGLIRKPQGTMHLRLSLKEPGPWPTRFKQEVTSMPKQLREILEMLTKGCVNGCAEKLPQEYMRREKTEVREASGRRYRCKSTKHDNHSSGKCETDATGSKDGLW